tara:strand:- start:139879 stop:140067 length:189 start_codon:yes stop_codon:yes gene_type:complete
LVARHNKLELVWGVAGRDVALDVRFFGEAFEAFAGFFLGDLLMGAETGARDWPNYGETRVAH